MNWHPALIRNCAGVAPVGKEGNKMQENTVLRKNTNMVTRIIEGEVILMPVYKDSNEINCIYTLNKVASLVWEMIDGKKTLGKIKKEVLKKFDTTKKEVDKELGIFLKELKEIKALA